MSASSLIFRLVSLVALAAASLTAQMLLAPFPSLSTPFSFGWLLYVGLAWLSSLAVSTNTECLLASSIAVRAKLLLRAGAVTALLLAFYIYGSGTRVPGPVALLSILTLAGHFALLIAFTTLTIRPAEVRREEYVRQQAVLIGPVVVLAATYIASYYYRQSTLVLTPTYRVILFTLVTSWIAVGALYHGFVIRRAGRLLDALWLYVIAEGVVLFITLSVIIAIRDTTHSRLLLLSTIAIAAAFENALVAVLLRTRPELATEPELSGDLDGDIDAIAPFASHDPAAARSKLSVAVDGTDRPTKPPSFLINMPSSWRQWIDSHLDVGGADSSSSACFKTSANENLDLISDDGLALLVNLECVNSIPNLSDFLNKANTKLHSDGMIAAAFCSDYQRRRHLCQIYPRPIALTISTISFVYYRLLPRLPLIRRLMVHLHGGRRFSQSLTEVLGRFYCSGFEVIAISEIDNEYRLVGRKVRSPLHNPVPRDGLLFRQSRVGMGGLTIQVYKLRTMHPYSEYLHEHLLKTASLAGNGKLDQDFRTPNWGRVLRELWIDELPMLLNWAKGDLKLVGVRPVSHSYFGIYPDDLKMERTRVKPGLIPPFYADLPVGQDAIFESERQYLRQYAAAPIRTDLQYFVRAARNIILRGARSS